MLLLFLLLISTCVSSRRHHVSDVDGVKEGFHGMLNSLLKRYNREERQKNDWKNDVAASEIAVENIAGKNEIESTIQKIHRRRKKHRSIQVDTINMPNVAPSAMDTYLCAAHKLPTDDRYIVKYEPSAKMQIAHHMLLFGCEVPFIKNGSSWNCREMQPVCGEGKQSIVYAWAKNAPSLEMPKNVGFHVGGKSGFNYLVLQVHYLHVSMFKDGVTDNSGVKFTLDKRKKRYIAGIYLLADGSTTIPPHRPKTYIDMGCLYSEGPRFIPFRFRVHAHKLGVVITGYRVRNNKWTLIGRGDPQRPQAFYKAFRHMVVKPGDTLMARCTFNSTSRNTTTYIGATHTDEMCNFYVMYYYDSEKYGEDKESTCEYPASQLFHDFPNSSDVPLTVMERWHHVEHSEEPHVAMLYKM